MEVVRAHAKLNLTLEIIRRRDDGYHDVVSIAQTVGMYDTLAFEPADTLTLECDITGLRSEDNLAWRAATALIDRHAPGRAARIRLDKGIPEAAGLGGGSSDAAATLLALNRLWDLGLGMDELSHIAASLGSDVPFFLHGGTAMLHGRGELVRPLPPTDLDWFVIVTPDIAIPQKTVAAYRAIGAGNMTRGALSRKLEGRIRTKGDVPPELLFNAFDGVAFDLYPGLETYWETMRSLGAREIHLAGSGPSIFTPVDRKETGTALELLLRHRHGWDARLVPAWRPAGADAD